MTDAAIDIKRWRDTPAVSGRAATELDVNAGRAVFVVGGEPVDLAIPACAIVREEGIGEATPVIVIQAERLEDGAVVVGFRMLDGGSGIAPLDDVELLSEPDERFR
ncbi:MAG TPA: hypothetical protein VND45_13365 [Thermoanaerobaculia bacterium]|nr:hypothetical protein [Thermoanaerobaculia bacterium]